MRLINLFKSGTPYYLRKTHKIFLSPDGEVCNRLKTGTKVLIINTKGFWADYLKK